MPGSCVFAGDRPFGYRLVAAALVDRARDDGAPDVERARAFERLVVVAMRSRYPGRHGAPGSDTLPNGTGAAQNGQLPAMFSDAATVNGAIPV